MQYVKIQLKVNTFTAYINSYIIYVYLCTVSFCHFRKKSVWVTYVNVDMSPVCRIYCSVCYVNLRSKKQHIDCISYKECIQLSRPHYLTWLQIHGGWYLICCDLKNCTFKILAYIVTAVSYLHLMPIIGKTFVGVKLKIICKITYCKNRRTSI